MKRPECVFHKKNFKKDRTRRVVQGAYQPALRNTLVNSKKAFVWSLIKLKHMLLKNTGEAHDDELTTAIIATMT